MARYLISGVAGFIGSWLAHTLVERGDQVRGIDNLSTGKLENLSAIAAHIDFREADLTDPRAMRSACEGIDIVLHQAALASVPRSVKDPLTSHQSNIEGTFQLLLAARDSGVRRVVYAASSSAYGDQPDLPKHERMLPKPISPYAVQKLTGEYYMQSFFNVYGLETVSLRYFNIFGPRQAADSPYSGVIAKFISNMLEGQSPTIFGDGEQTRDFTYIENAVQANLLAASLPAEKISGRVFNIATGDRHSLNKTFYVLSELTGFQGQPIYGPARAGDIRDSLADISLAAEVLGYRPSVDFADGLGRTVAWYLEQLAPMNVTSKTPSKAGGSSR